VTCHWDMINTNLIYVNALHTSYILHGLLFPGWRILSTGRALNNFAATLGGKRLVLSLVKWTGHGFPHGFPLLDDFEGRPGRHYTGLF